MNPVKTIEKLKSSALKLVAVTYEGCMLTRGPANNVDWKNLGILETCSLKINVKFFFPNFVFFRCFVAMAAVLNQKN